MTKFLVFFELMRLGNPTGYLLLFFPCAFGALLAIDRSEQFWYLPLFLLGSITMRGAGCIINDLIDRDIDAKVERTKSRPIASGRISLKEAILLLCILLLVSLPLLLILHAEAIAIGAFSIILVTLYPWMKRITYWPQAFLGLTFNIGTLIAYTGLGHQIDLPIVLVYLGCISWTLGYDTIYAFMDIEDDAKIGIKSSALFLCNYQYKTWIAVFYLVFNILMMVASLWIFGTDIGIFVSITIALGICLWQVVTLDISSQRNCLVRFKSNIYVGLVWMIPLIVYRINA